MRNPSGKQPQTLATKKTKWQRSIEEFGCDLFAGSRNPGTYPAGQGQNQRGFQRRRRDHCHQKKTRLVSFQHKKIVTHEKQRMPFYTPLVTRFQPTRQHADSKKPLCIQWRMATLNCRGSNSQSKKEQVMEIMHQLNIDVLSCSFFSRHINQFLHKRFLN